MNSLRGNVDKDQKVNLGNSPANFYDMMRRINVFDLLSFQFTMKTQRKFPVFRHKRNKENIVLNMNPHHGYPYPGYVPNAYPPGYVAPAVYPPGYVMPQQPQYAQPIYPPGYVMPQPVYVAPPMVYPPVMPPVVYPTGAYVQPGMFFTQFYDLFEFMKGCTQCIRTVVTMENLNSKKCSNINQQISAYLY